MIGIGTSAEWRENLVEFACSNCQLSVKCRHGKLEFEKARYREECYYMRNPFEPPNFHKAQKEYTIDDFVVVGSKCFICEQQICVDEVMSNLKSFNSRFLGMFTFLQKYLLPQLCLEGTSQLSGRIDFSGQFFYFNFIP